MLDRLSTLRQFSVAYWNQMGDEVYGTIGSAFRAFLSDAARLPDEGQGLRKTLRGELMLISGSAEYDEWVRFARFDEDTGRAVGGRIILPEQVAPLIAILNERTEPGS